MLKQHLLFCFFICYFTSILAQTKDNTTSDVPQQKDKTTTTIADNILADMVADSITLANAEVKKKGAISEIISREVLDMKIYTPDTAAEAVVLYDMGDLALSNSGRFILNRTRQIKILKQRGIREYGNFELAIDTNRQDLIRFKARIIQPDSSIVWLKDDNIFTEKLSGSRIVKKVAFPNVKEGSILEIKYALSVGSLDLFRWRFQEDIPIRHSMLVLDLPSTIQYEFLFKGLIDYKTGIVTRKGMFNGTFDVPALIMDTVPAFISEPFMPPMKDAACGISFNWKRMEFPATYYTNQQVFINNWDFMTKMYLEEKSFGDQYQKKSKYGDVWKAVKPLLASTKSVEGTMKIVYDYISNNIAWDEYFSAFVQDDLDKAFKKKKANSGEMNLMMVACLREAGVKAYPLLVSTSDNGIPSSAFSSAHQFNHVLCYVENGDDTYFLDAGNSARNIYLPRRVSLNGQGWLVDKENARWIDLPKPLSYLSTNAAFSLDKQGVLKGTLTHLYNGYAAVDERDNLKKDPKKEFVRKEFPSGLIELKVDNIKYDKVDSLYAPLTRTLDCEIQESEPVSDNLIVVNPSFLVHYTSFAFVGEERKHFIQFNHPVKEDFNLTLTIPEGYVVEEMPSNLSSTLGKTDATFFFTTTTKDNKIEINTSFYIKKTLYHHNRYKEIKAFFDGVVKKSNEQIVFKKKS